MGKDILTFGDTEIEKNKSYRLKTSIFFKDIDIKKILVSYKISSGKKICKYFIDYLYNEQKFKPLHIMLSQTSAYVKGYDRQTKWMYF